MAPAMAAKEAVFESIRRAKLGPRVIPAGVQILITTCGRFTPDVVHDILPARLEYDDEIYRALAGVKIESSIVAIIAFPTILDPRIGSMADFVSYDRSGFVRVGINIDHETWVGAADEEKLDLYAANIEESIARIRRSTLPAKDRDALREVLASARIAARAALRPC